MRGETIMRILLSYFRLMLFVLGVLAGVQVPHFIHQYGNALAAHYEESQRALDEFQQEADRFFDGDIEQLIRYYQQSDDKVFVEGGKSIAAIYQRNQQLGKALQDFHQSRFNAFRQVFLQPIDDIRAQVQQQYTYAIQLTPTAIVSGLSLGLLVAIASETLLRLLFWPLMRSRRQRHKRSLDIG